MRRSASLFAALLVLAMALTPSLAFARAGDGVSAGSRGTRTYSAPAPTNTAPSQAAPMQRSLTPQPAPTPGYGAPQQQPGFGQPPIGARPSFMSGLMGGLIGVGIGSMLFGGGMFHGIGSFGGMLSFLIQALLIFFVGRWLLRMIFNRAPQPAMAGGPAMFTPQQGAMPGGTRPQAPPVQIGPADYQAFEQLLQAVQAAWTQHDLTTLRMVATPEMVSYFGEQLAEQTSRGVRNLVTDVKLDQGDLSEAWAEQGREYATVAMKFSMIDVTKNAQGQVVDGNPTQRTQATEIWTFLRAPGGRWVLSAIQQVRS